ncbi:MAG: clostripain-related cysteine peptidase [Candidatus Xenobia bacterium]
MILVAQSSGAPGALDKWTGDWSGTKRYLIESNGKKWSTWNILKESLASMKPPYTKGITSPVVEDMGKDVDAGDPRTLQNFVQWGMQAYPAKHYMLVMLGPTDGVQGVMHDALHNSKMLLPEVRQALENAEAASGGKKLDILALDGSQGSTMEMGDELKGVTNYLMGSQSVQTGQGAPLMQVFNEVKNASDPTAVDPLTLVRLYALMNSAGAGNAAVTTSFSAMDLTKLPALTKAFNDLGQALLDTNVSGKKLREVAMQTQDFQGLSNNQDLGTLKDVYHFAQLLSEDKSMDPKVASAARATMAAVDDTLVGDAEGGKYMSNAHGISVSMPTNFGHFHPDTLAEVAKNDRRGHYDELALAKDTCWTKVLEKMSQDSLMDRTLSRLGLKDDTIDKLDAASGTAGQLAKTVSSFASLAGTLNAFNVMGGGKGAGFLGLSAQHAAMAGLYGSAFDASQTAASSIAGLRKYGDTDTAVASLFDLAAAGGKAVANAGVFVPALAPYGQMAAMGWFAMPWIKQVYGVYQQYKAIRGSVELSTGQNKLQDLGEAVQNYYGNKFVWDQVPKTNKD